MDSGSVMDQSGKVIDGFWMVIRVDERLQLVLEIREILYRNRNINRGELLCCRAPGPVGEGEGNHGHILSRSYLICNRFALTGHTSSLYFSHAVKAQSYYRLLFQRGNEGVSDSRQETRRRILRICPCCHSPFLKHQWIIYLQNYR